MQSKYNYKPPQGSTVDYNHPLAQGLVYCVLFNENSGNILKDLSAQNDNTNLLNGPSWNGDYSGSLFFDGSNDNTISTIGTTFYNYKKDFAVFTIYKRVSVPSLGYFGQSVNNTDNGNTNVWIFHNGGGNSLYFGVYTQSGLKSTAAYTINSNQWYSLAGTYNGAQVKFYVDGTLRGTANTTEDMKVSPNSQIMLGKDPRFGFFHSCYHAVTYVYNRSLAEEEIRSLHENPYQFINNPAAIQYSIFQQQYKTLGVSSITTLESLGNNYVSGPISIKAPTIPISASIGSINFKLDDFDYIKKNIINKVQSYTFDSTAIIRDYKPLDPPSEIRYQLFGTPGSTTYSYKITSVNSQGESHTSIIKIYNGNSTLDSTNFIRILWKTNTKITSYKIYGRTENNERFLNQVSSTNYFDDIGSITPGAIAPISNTTGYDPNKLNLGPLIRLYTGKTNSENYISPITYTSSISTYDRMGNFTRSSNIIDYGDKILIFSDYYGSWNYRPLYLTVYYKNTQIFRYEGYIYFQNPFGNSESRRGDVTLYNHTSGSVTVSGTSVTGVGTSWISERVARGARIGFGTTDPLKVTKWYEIATINSDTSITLSTSAISFPANTAYVIEEMRWLLGTTNAGLMIVKGLNLDLFTIAPSLIPFATTIDNIRAVYILKNAPTNTLTTYSTGIIDDTYSFTNHIFYLVHGNGAPTGRAIKIAKFNIRASLTPTSGASEAAYLFETGWNYTENFADYSLNLLTIKHGPYANKKILATTDQSHYIYTIPESNIKANATNLMEHRTYPNPPGGTNSTRFDGGRDVYYDDILDRTFIVASGGLTMYSKTKYDYSPHDFMKYGRTLYSNEFRSPQWKVPYHVNHYFAPSFFKVVEGYLLTENNMQGRQTRYINIPLHADWSVAKETKNRVITPKMSTINASRYDKLFVNHGLNYGIETHGLRPEPFRVFYRKTGIDDDTGEWFRIPRTGDLSYVTPSDYIQFMFEFKVFSRHCFTSRLNSINLTYETDENLPEQFVFNLSDTNIALGIIGFKQISLYDSLNILEIDLKRNNKNTFTQKSTESTYGVFEYYSNGWIQGIGPNAIGTRRRFRLTSQIINLSNDVKIYRVR